MLDFVVGSIGKAHTTVTYAIIRPVIAKTDNCFNPGNGVQAKTAYAKIIFNRPKLIPGKIFFRLCSGDEVFFSSSRSA